MRLLTIERQVIVTLFDRLGLLGTLSVIAGILFEKLSYRPFRSLPSMEGGSEVLARKHVRDALILYRVLERRLADEAITLYRLAMAEGAQAFLTAQIGTINREHYQSMDSRAREGWLKRLVSRFPNATATIDEASENRVAFTVTRCRHVELTCAAGYAELASVFCAGDAAFFSGQPIGISFERTMSIAQGDAACPFVLTLDAVPDEQEKPFR